MRQKEKSLQRCKPYSDHPEAGIHEVRQTTADTEISPKLEI